MDVRARSDRIVTASALALEHIAKRFGDVDALLDASIVVRPGTVHALLGENGAGKTTLMRIAYGLERPDRGTLRIGDHPLSPGSPRIAIRAGIGMVHQHFAIVAAMTVAENISLGRRGRFSRERAAAHAAAVAAHAGLALDPDARAGDLHVGAQQRLEIAKALASDARVLILDEPTAVLAPAEADELLRWVRGFAHSGRAAVLITHKLREALSIADDVTVIRRGRTVLSASAHQLAESDVVRAMVGETVARSIASPNVAPSSDDRIAAEAIGLSLVDERGTARVRDATFAIRRGEIVGIAAVEGSGQRELLRALAGRLPPSSGSLGIPARIGFIPEDRHHDALALDLSVAENVALRDAGARRGRMNWPLLRRHAAALIAAHDVRAAGVEAPVRSLSGGNQQKLVFARELDGDPELLVAESPTRGLDIRATAALHANMRAARAAGVALVVYSSDLDEVLALADRVLVVFAGTVREVPRDRDAVGRAMLGLP